MRILSQDGKIDIPYDNFVFSITKDNCIVATRDSVATLSEIESGVVAKYSTTDKARKAMEMLREAYCGVPNLKNENYELGEFDLKRIEKEMKKPHFLEVIPNNSVAECMVFLFPSDDELEV